MTAYVCIVGGWGPNIHQLLKGVVTHRRQEERTAPPPLTAEATEACKGSGGSKLPGDASELVTEPGSDLARHVEPPCPPPSSPYSHFMPARGIL